MTRTRRSFLFFIVIALSAAGARADDVDSFLQSRISSRHLPSLAVAVVKNGEPIKLRGYGFADVENQVPASADSVYLLASVTKQFTATAVMMLVRDGKIRLDDKAGKYLDAAPDAWKDITVRHLLNHTAGLSRTIPFPRSPGSIIADHTPREFLTMSGAQPLMFQPGEKFSYSNTGYWLLGYLIERASGKSYWDFLRERIFQPLGMTATRSSDPRAIVPNRAGAYGWDRDGFVNRNHPSATMGFSAGCLLSTARDMAKWDAALNTDKLLPQSELARMWTPGKLNSGASTSYGFGWTAGDERGHRTIAHSGAFDGASTAITRFVDDKLTVIVLINRDQANAAGLANQVAGLYIPALRRPSAGPATNDPDSERSARLKKLLADIAAGADSSDLTPGVKASLKSAPWVTRMAPMLKNPEEFAFLRCEVAGSAELEKNGSKVVKLCHYRTSLAGRSIDWSFYLTPDGKVAAVQPQR